MCGHVGIDWVFLSRDRLSESLGLSFCLLMKKSKSAWMLFCRLCKNYKESNVVLMWNYIEYRI